MQSRKYAKWKAAYIHNCLKNGETPHAGPLPLEGEDELGDVASGGSPAPSAGMGWNTNPYAQPQNPYQPPQDPYANPQGPYQPPPPAHNFQPGPQAPAAANLPFHLPDPPTDPEPKNPGGFVPYKPSPDSTAFEPSKSSSSLSPEQIAKAQKYCKYIQSALTYEDIPTAINNLHMCLKLLQTGQDS